jgi:hypothetical protein
LKTNSGDDKHMRCVTQVPTAPLSLTLSHKRTFRGEKTKQNKTTPKADGPSECYTNCYYSALLGGNAGGVVPSTGGLDGPAITKIWVDAFDNCRAL